MLEDGDDWCNLGPHLAFLEDPEGSWTIDDVAAPALAGQFIALDRQHANFGLSSSAFWLRFTVETPPPAAAPLAPRSPDWLVYVDRATLDAVAFYSPLSGDAPSAEAGNWRVERAGPAVAGENGDDRRGPLAFRLPPRMEATTYYLRVRNERGLYLPVAICTEDAYLNVCRRRMLGYGVFYGILIIMACYNAALFVSLRDRTHLWCVAYIVLAGIYFLGLNGLVQELVPAHRHAMVSRITLASLCGAALAGAMLTRAFLVTRLTLRWGYRMLLAYAVITAAILVLFPFASRQTVGGLMSIMGVLVLPIVLGLNIAAWCRGFQPARFLLFGWVALGFGEGAYALMYRGALPYTSWSHYGFQVGLALQIILFTFALAERFRTVEEEHQATQAAMDKVTHVNALQSLVLDTSLMGVAFMRNHAIEWMNPRLAEILRTAGEELTGESLAPFFTDEGAYNGFIEAIEERFRAGESHAEERLLVRGDGKPFWARMVGRPVKQGELDSGTVWLLEDITERKLAEEALRESRERYKNLFNTTLVGLFRSTLDGRSVLAANPAAANLFGYESVRAFIEECVPRETYVHPARREALTRLLDKDSKVEGFEFQAWDRYGRQHSFSLSAVAYPKLGYLEGALVDITQRVRIEEALRESEERYRRLIENLREEYFFYTQAPDGSFTFLSPSVTNVLGYTPAEFQTGFEGFFTDDPINEKARYHREQSLRGIQQPLYNSEVAHKDGSAHWFDILEVPIVSAAGEIIAVEGAAHDVTSRRKADQELERLATTDPLTGAFNRRYFIEASEEEARRARRYGRNLALLMLDIDHFKTINDTYGHTVGDDALKAFTETCLATLRENDLLGRVGGEEFAALLPESDGLAAREAAERLRTRVADIRIDAPNGGTAQFTVSIGIATLEPKDITLEPILNRADQALYQAKRAGRDRVVAG